jgi:AcrR family transcriptional regulator
MAGLRERKRRRTFKAIHDAALRLFEERGYGAVTVADIAEAAEVSRATVFAYYPAKEDIVAGDARFAIEGLEAQLARPDVPVVESMREWLRTLVGWMEPDIVLQRRLAEEVPAVAAARSRLRRDIEAVIAAALVREMGSADPLVPRLVAGSLASALTVVEQEAAARMEHGDRALGEDEVDALFDTAVAFAEGGLERVRVTQDVAHFWT